MTKLLVSVRSVEEASAALEGGADIIDVKEPSRGALGRADDDVIDAVMNCVAGHDPVSAALGELADEPSPPPPGLAYVKVGLAGLDDNWRQRWNTWRRTVVNPVLVAYADECNVVEMMEFANETRPAAFLIDTLHKAGQTLLDYLPLDRLLRLRKTCRVPFAIAGSLNLELIEQLAVMDPDIIGVRSAACRGGRHGMVDSALVREISNRLVRPACKG